MFEHSTVGDGEKERLLLVSHDVVVNVERLSK